MDHAPEAVQVRDSQEEEGPKFAVSSSTWGDFLGYATE
ncbi:DUF397 domain-containing protein [Streptomyces kebangsaanensis]